MLDVLETLRDGDVVTLAAGSGVGVVVGAAGSPRAQVVTDDRRLIRLHPQQFRRPPAVVGRVALPTSGGPRQASYRREVADALSTVQSSPADDGAASGADDAAEQARAERIAELRAAVRAHPVHTDDRRADIEHWAARYDELATTTRRLQADVDRRTGSLSRQLRRIVSVLTELGYLEGDAAAPAPSPDGLRLAMLYADTDLLLAECLRDGVLDGLDDADLAAVTSVFVHETRARDVPPVWYPTATVAERVERVERHWERLAGIERSAGLEATRAPDASIAGQVWLWAQGAELDDVLDGGALTGGDFVRHVKQIADLSRQLGVACRHTDVGAQARRVADRLLRGVVAAA